MLINNIDDTRVSRYTTDSSTVNNGSVNTKTLNLTQLITEVQKLLKKQLLATEEVLHMRTGLVYQIQENAHHNQTKSLDKQREGIAYQIGGAVAGALGSIGTGIAPSLATNHNAASIATATMGGLTNMVPGILDSVKTSNIDVEVNKLKYLEQYQSGNFKTASELLINDTRKTADKYTEMQNTTRELNAILKQLSDAVSFK